MNVKVYDKNDSFDTQVELSRKFIEEYFGKFPIKLEKDDQVFELVTDEWKSVIVTNDGYYSSPDDVLLEYGVVAQYQ